jgi:hypothetical protein
MRRIVSPGRIGNPAARIAGHRQWESTHRGRLVHHDQHVAVLGLQLLEQFTQPRFTIWHRLVEHLLARRSQRSAVMFALADVQTEVDVDLTVVVHTPPQQPLSRSRARHQRAGIHVTKACSSMVRM